MESLSILGPLGVRSCVWTSLNPASLVWRMNLSPRAGASLQMTQLLNGGVGQRNSGLRLQVSSHLYHSFSPSTGCPEGGEAVGDVNEKSSSPTPVFSWKNDLKVSFLQVFFVCLFVWGFFVFVFWTFRATSMAYRCSQARDLIRTVVAGLSQSHSNARSYTTAHSNAGSLIHWARPGMEPAPSWFLVGFVSAAPWWELLSK